MDRHPSVSKYASTLVLVALIAVGAVLRLWGVQFALPNPYARPDEEVIVDVALGFFSDPNPHFFDWPTLFFHLTAAAYAALFAFERAVGGTITSAAVAKASLEPILYLIPRLISVTAGVLTIPILYGASKELFPRRVGLLAAGFLAVAFLHVRDSHFGVTDVTMTCLAVSAFWAALRCETHGPTPVRAALAGLLCGLAASTKYNAALIALPAVVAILHRSIWPQPGSMPAAIRALSSFVACAILAFVAGTPFSLLDHESFIGAVTAVRRHLAAGHVVMARGWTYHATFTFRYGLGVPLSIAAVGGACWLIARDRWQALLVLIFPVAYYVVVGSGLTVFVRYMMPMVPFLCLTAALFVDRVAVFLSTRFKMSAVGDAVAVAVLAAIIAAPTARVSIAFDRLMTKRDTRVLAENWIASRFPNGGTIYQSGYGYSHAFPRPFQHFSNFNFNERLNRFQMLGGATIDLPDIIVLPESPLGTYTQVPPKVRSLVDASYVLTATIEGASAANAPGALYDQDDAFFAPFAGIDEVTRPGPTMKIFERKAP